VAIFDYVKYIVVCEIATSFRLPSACGLKHTLGISQLPARVPVLPWRSLIGRLLFELFPGSRAVSGGRPLGAVMFEWR